MENSKLYNFLDQIENYSIQEVSEKLLSFTENANLELLFNLRAEVYLYYKQKFIQMHPEELIEAGMESKTSPKIMLYNNLIYPFFHGFSDKFWELSVKFGERVVVKIQNSIDEFWCYNSLANIDSIVRKLGHFNRELDQLLINQLSRSSSYQQIKDFGSNQIKTLNPSGGMGNSIDDEPIYDLSDTKIVQKLIYLNELGLIDFLRMSQPFDMSTNKLATVLSAITGEKPNSIQPALNTLITDKELINKNNPYCNPNNSIKVRQRLLDLGYELKVDHFSNDSDK